MAFNENYQFESVTEYDIAEPKKYDIKLGAAKKIILSGYRGEKICVRLGSDTLITLENDFKVKIDDTRNRIDVGVIRKDGVTEAAAKEAVTVYVQIPSPYIGKIELAADAETVEVHSLDCDDIEMNLKAQNVLLEDVVGKVEIDCNLDMNVICPTINGEIAINQVSASSKISVPEGAAFTAVAKGVGTSISYEKNGAPTEAFDAPGADNIIELNGMKSKLVICTLAKEV